jgi:hypothetical protein
MHGASGACGSGSESSHLESQQRKENAEHDCVRRDQPQQGEGTSPRLNHQEDAQRNRGEAAKSKPPLALDFFP